MVNGWVEVEGGSGRYQLVGFDLFAEGPFRSQLTGVANRAGFTSDWLTQRRLEAYEVWIGILEEG